jgi:hypothetical protein
MGDTATQADLEQVETEELEPQTELVEVPAGEPSEDSLEQPDGDEIEIVLKEDPTGADNEPPRKPNRVRQMRQRISELKQGSKDKDQTIQALEAQVAQLSARVEELSAQPAPTPTRPAGAPGGPLPKRPELAEYNWDADAYGDALVKWTADNLIATTEANQQQQARSQQQQAAINSHYVRANSLNVMDYEQAEDRAAQVLGVDIVEGIQAKVPDSEKLLYFLGKNENKLSYFRDLFASDPGRATFELGRMSTNLVPQPKRKTPPDPDIPIKGGGGSSLDPKAKPFMKKLTTAYEKGDLAAARAARKEAKAAGIELPLNPTE